MSFTVVGSNIILSHYVSLSLSQYHSSSVFFYFMMLTVLKTTDQNFCRTPWFGFVCFLMIVLGFGTWGKTSTEVKCPSHCIILGVILTWVIPGAVNLGQLAKVMSARFLHCKGIIFPFIISKQVIKFNSNSKGQALNPTSWRGRHLHLEFLHKRDFFFSSPLSS